jgi:predicted alpha/beta superfamily hydrolase
MRKAGYFSLFAITLMFVIPLPGNGQSETEDIILGKSIRFTSEVLGEEREIMVALPDGYEQTSTKYPVLYLLDGRTHFLHATSTVQFLSRNGRMPQMIVVAIVNVDRTRDFTPTHIEERPGSGGYEKFIAFMQKELFPYIEQKYRTVPYRLLEGHSLGGMFCLNVLMDFPEMFQAHFAMSPYIMWDSNYILFKSKNFFQESHEFKNFLYITLGNEPPYVEPLGEYTNLLKTKKTNGLEWHFEVMNDDNHGTVPLKSLYNGLETLYQNWQLKVAVEDEGLNAVKAHYLGLSKKYGYQIQIPENVLNTLGYRAIRMQKFNTAIEFFLYNVDIYPESVNVYDSLGEGYEAAGKLDLARKNYQIAVEKGKKTNHINLAIYKEHLDKVTRKLQDKDSTDI